MNPVISKIAARRIPTTSHIRAVDFINTEIGKHTDPSYYNLVLTELTNSKVDFEDYKVSRFTFLYFVHDAILLDRKGVQIDVKKLLVEVTQKAILYVKDHPWVFLVDDAAADENKPVKLDSEGKPKQKHGAKKQRALEIYRTHCQSKDRKEIVDLFVKEAGFIPSSAMTYYYICKKEVEQNG